MVLASTNVINDSISGVINKERNHKNYNSLSGPFRKSSFFTTGHIAALNFPYPVLCL